MNNREWDESQKTFAERDAELSEAELNFKNNITAKMRELLTEDDFREIGKRVGKLLEKIIEQDVSQFNL